MERDENGGEGMGKGKGEDGKGMDKEVKKIKK